MKIYDISWPISAEITAYKDKKTVHFEEVKSFDQDRVRESTLTLNAHSGTHIDAPSHFLRDGDTIDALDLAAVIGPCTVFDLSGIRDRITHEHLEKLSIQEGDRILFKTSNSLVLATEKFNPHFVYLAASGAEYLIERRISAVGIDYLGIERNQADHITHTLLFDHGITIIEGLRLAAVKEGRYFLCCLPLYAIGLEAAPARAVLMENL